MAAVKAFSPPSSITRSRPKAARRRSARLLIFGAWGYAYFQLLGEAVEGAKTVNDDKLAVYMRCHSFANILVQQLRVQASVNGPSATPTLQLQYRGLVDAAILETYQLPLARRGDQKVLTTGSGNPRVDLSLRQGEIAFTRTALGPRPTSKSKID